MVKFPKYDERHESISKGSSIILSNKNSKRPTMRYIIIKLSKMQGQKENIEKNKNKIYSSCIIYPKCDY